MKSSIYESALRKTKRFSDTTEFCGCYTNQEILSLLDNGAIPINSYKDIRKSLEEESSKGITFNRWFYFYLNKKLKEDIIKWNPLKNKKF